MSKESTKDFAEKFYTDDEFLKDLCKRGGLNSKASEKEKTELLLKTASEMGYDFTEDEYRKANEDYFVGMGAWGVIKTFRCINKIAKAALKKKIKKYIWLLFLILSNILQRLTYFLKV